MFESMKVYCPILHLLPECRDIFGIKVVSVKVESNDAAMALEQLCQKMRFRSFELISGVRDRFMLWSKVFHLYYGSPFSKSRSMWSPEYPGDIMSSLE